MPRVWRSSPASSQRKGQRVRAWVQSTVDSTSQDQYSDAKSPRIVRAGKLFASVRVTDYEGNWKPEKMEIDASPNTPRGLHFDSSGLRVPH